MPTTQSAHPWRATLRTALAAAVALAPALPEIARTAGVATVPVVAGALVLAGGVTRVLASPAVEDWLRDFVPWLAAAPRD